jgi:hypothetical protein
MSDADTNLETGVEADAQPFDAVAAFSQTLDKDFSAPPAPDADPDQDLIDQLEPGEAEENAEEPEEPVYKVKVSGEEIEVPLSELLNGYSRESDYRNKTKELAQAKRETEAYRSQVDQVVNSERQQLQQAAQFFLSQLPQVQPPDPRLIDAQPTEYLRQKELFERVNSQRSMAMNAIQQAQLKQQADAEAAMAQRVQMGHEILAQVLPEWNDQAKRAEASRAIVEHVSQYGFDPQELASIADPRVIVLMKDAVSNAEKARKFDELVAKSQTTAKKVQQLPPRAERPGRGNVSNTDGRTQAMKALKKTGSTEAAANIFASML